MQKVHAAITAVGGYVPDYIMTNAELEKIVDTTDEWIQTRTGIKERRILKGEGKGTSDMAVEAIKDLVRKKGLDLLDVECIICATTTPDFTFPATANVISDKLRLRRQRCLQRIFICAHHRCFLHRERSLQKSDRRGWRQNELHPQLRRSHYLYHFRRWLRCRSSGTKY